MNKFEILCVDDEVEILELYELELEDLPYNIKTISSPLDALSYLKDNHTKIVCVISDYKMPEMTGLDLRAQMNDADVKCPFVMVTGFYDKEMAIRGMELKIEKFLQKPFNGSELIEVVTTAAGKYKTLLEEEEEMIKSFVDESSPMLEEIEELILILEEDPKNENALNTYFRLLHTIKGTASCVGLKSLPDYTHKYEDLVGMLKDKKLDVSISIIEVLLKGLDKLKFMYETISSGEAFEFDISKDIGVFNLDNISKDEKTEDKEESKKEVAVVKKVEDEKLSVQVSLLDGFMENSGEITVLRNMVNKNIAKIMNKYQGDKDLDVLSEALDEMHKVSSLLQNQITEMRKVSLDAVYRPLKRVVRDASKKLEKKIKFETSGEDLRVDTSLGKVLSNVLVHLIRNGIDHGLEKPDVRLERGKSEEGNLQLSTYSEGENIFVEIIDDGNGIDKERLIEKALEKDLYTQVELEKMSDQRLFSMIFDSGFSTAAEVTDISGRGVGMDMVKSSIESIGGKIIIDSTLGEGTKFLLMLPIPRSVLIIKTLMVECQGAQFAIPLQDVGEVLNLDESNNTQIHKLEGSNVIKHHDEIIPYVSLGGEFYPDGYNSNPRNVVLIRGEGFNYGIAVDSILDIEEVVVKKMAKQLQEETVPFQGATFLGEGEMALILDLELLAKKVNIVIDDSDSELALNGVTDMSEEMREYLQFSFSKRDDFCVPLMFVDRLEEIKSSLIEYSGSLPLVRYRESFLSLIDLSFALGFSHCPQAEYPEEINVLVINHEGNKFGFIVSEISDIKNSSEALDTLIKDRAGILGNIYIDGKFLNVLDVNEVIRSYKDKYKSLSSRSMDTKLAA